MRISDKTLRILLPLLAAAFLAPCLAACKPQNQSEPETRTCTKPSVGWNAKRFRQDGELYHFLEFKVTDTDGTRLATPRLTLPDKTVGSCSIIRRENGLSNIQEHDFFGRLQLRDEGFHVFAYAEFISDKESKVTWMYYQTEEEKSPEPPHSTELQVWGIGLGEATIADAEIMELPGP